MGWLVFEASLDRFWSSRPSSSGSKAPTARRHGRPPPCPAPGERRPRAALAGVRLAALGAIRAEALVESKRDTEDGYDAAYILHQEARGTCKQYQGTLGGRRRWRWTRC